MASAQRNEGASDIAFRWIDATHIPTPGTKKASNGRRRKW